MRLWNYSDRWLIGIELNPKWGPMPENWLWAIDWGKLRRLGITGSGTTQLDLRPIREDCAELEVLFSGGDLEVLMGKPRIIDEVAREIADGSRGPGSGLNLGRLNHLEPLQPVSDGNFLLKAGTLAFMRFGPRETYGPVCARDRIRMRREKTIDMHRNPMKHLPESACAGLVPMRRSYCLGA